MRYINGNYIVRCWDSGVNFCIAKTALRVGEELCPDFPDSIDLKISNKCSWGCPFCHENSVPTGKIFDLQKTEAILSQLPKKTPIELAIGGGNILDSVDEISPFIDWAKDYGFLVRCTINHKDLENLTKEKIELLGKFNGIGISIDRIPEEKYLQVVKVEVENKGYLRFLGKEDIDKINNQYIFPFNTTRRRRWNDEKAVVFHIIAGVFPPEQFSALSQTGHPILVLGYKQWGRAKQSLLPDMTGIKKEIEKHLSVLMKGKDIFDSHERSVLCFDNLAIEQLGIRDIVGDKETWDKIYMGDEGKFSMYIDAVEGMYAKTSRSQERRSWDDVELLEFFKDDSISV